MEIAMRRVPEPVSPEDYVKSCRTSASVDDALACWGYLGLSLDTNDVPLADAAGWCAKADLPGQFRCIEQHGRDLGVKRLTQCEDVDGSEALRHRCVSGALGLQIGSGHVSIDDALRACDELEADPSVRFCRAAARRFDQSRERLEDTA
jgi:hypothetical protein